jgi:hypothetical protein
MAEPTSRIERSSSYRDPEAQPQRGRPKHNARPKPAPPLEPELADQPSAGAEEQEKHELDTLA